jgi:hypothetical protein
MRQDLTGAICIVKNLWSYPFTVNDRDGTVEIVLDAELASEVPPGRRAPVLRGSGRTYEGGTWQEAVRAAGKGEGVDPRRINRRIAVAERAEREGLSIYLPESDGVVHLRYNSRTAAANQGEDEYVNTKCGQKVPNVNGIVEDVVGDGPEDARRLASPDRVVCSNCLK